MDSKYNPLIEAFFILIQREHPSLEASTLFAALPSDIHEKQISTFIYQTGQDLLSRLSENAGFETKLFKKELTSIPSLTLPVIILLQNNEVAILESFSDDKKEVSVSIDSQPITMSTEALCDTYLGYGFYLRKSETYHEARDVAKGDDKHWFFSTLWSSKKLYTDVIIASVMINLFVLATPLFTMNVYDRVVPNNATETLWVLALGIGVIFLFDFILKMLRIYFLELAGKKSDIGVSAKLYEQVIHLKLEAKPRSVGAFASNLKEFDTLRNFLTSSTVSALIDLPFLMLFLFITYSIAGEIVFVPIAMIGILLLFTLAVRKPLYRSIMQTFEAVSQKNGALIETLASLENLKALGATSHLQKRYEHSSATIAQRGIKAKILSSSIPTLTGFKHNLTR